jgi:hypothetical protein
MREIFKRLDFTQTASTVVDEGLKNPNQVTREGVILSSYIPRDEVASLPTMYLSRINLK